MEGAESVLRGGEGEGCGEGREEEALQNFDGRAEEGDGAVGGAGGKGLTRFGDGYDGCRLPDGRDVGSGEGKVEELSQEMDA